FARVRGCRTFGGHTSSLRLRSALGEEIDEVDLGDDADDAFTLGDDGHLRVRENRLEQLDFGFGRDGGVVALDEARDGRVERAAARYEVAQEVDLGDEASELAVFDDRQLADAERLQSGDDVAHLVRRARAHDRAGFALQEV